MTSSSLHCAKIALQIYLYVYVFVQVYVYIFFSGNLTADVIHATC